MLLGYCGVYYSGKGTMTGFPWYGAIGQALAVVVAIAIGRHIMQGHSRRADDAL